jgi:hypothetical protein
MESLKAFLREHLRFFAAAIPLCAVVSAFYLLARHSGGDRAWIGLPLDDGWIHLVCARSLAELGGFHFNPGVAEEGMSSPLWVILLAPVYKVLTPLGVSPQWCAKGLSLLFAIGVPLAAYHAALAFRLNKRWAWFAGSAVAAEPNLAYGNVAGMEVPLFTFLTLLALTLSLHRRWVLTGLVLGLVVIARGALLVFGWNAFHLHEHLTEKYSWNTENIGTVNVAMGKRIAENLPPEATIGVTEAGAMRFRSRPDQTIIDFLGLNCAACIGRLMEEPLAELHPGYLVVFRPALTGSFAFEELHSIRAWKNTVLGGNELVAVKLEP